MIQTIDFHIKQLDSMKKYPQEIFYIGDTSLLKKTKVSIVGSRKPNQYARNIIHQLSAKLAQTGVCIVSGGALGIDTIAHLAAGLDNTIMVAGTGLDKRYPIINKNMIQEIEKNGLLLSQFRKGVPSNRWNFPLRNELIVALGEVLVVAYADKNSGTMRSIEYALKMGKEVYVLPHRLDESDGTNELLGKGLVKAIYNINDFVLKFSQIQNEDGSLNRFLKYCQTNPTYDEAIEKYGALVFEYELQGKIYIDKGMVFTL
jgi:DNA processing protein